MGGDFFGELGRGFGALLGQGFAELVRCRSTFGDDGAEFFDLVAPVLDAGELLFHIVAKGDDGLDGGAVFALQRLQDVEALLELCQLFGIDFQLLCVFCDAGLHVGKLDLRGLEAFKHLRCGGIDLFQLMDVAAEIAEEGHDAALVLAEETCDLPTEFDEAGAVCRDAVAGLDLFFFARLELGAADFLGLEAQHVDLLLVGAF